MNTQFRKGVLEICVLTLISKKDMYGYEIVQNISKVIEVNEGTIYPILRRLTKEGYFKKITQVSLRMFSEQRLKEDDEIVVSEETSNRETLVFFSDKGNVYKIKLSMFSDTKASSIGDYLPNILEMEDDEKISQAGIWQKR